MIALAVCLILLQILFQHKSVTSPRVWYNLVLARERLEIKRAQKQTLQHGAFIA
jgi:hypothetical protein